MLDSDAFLCRGRLEGMEVMVIERFKFGPGPVRERFLSKGRMLSENVEYIGSWLTESGDLCYQVMRCSAVCDLDSWIAAWSDLVDFEVIPVANSAQFWKDWERKGTP
jgi:hypothetical protein